eukprot:87175_1
MGSDFSTSYFYGEGDLAGWLVITLWSMNGITMIMTCINIFYLKKALPRVVERGWNQATEESLTISVHASSSHSTSIQYFPNGYVDPTTELEQRRQFYRYRIQLYFYFITIIPLGVSAVSHWSARWPQAAIWIIPSMNIVIAFAFLAFMRMMIMSCEGWKEVSLLLRDQKDECKSCKKRKLINFCCIRCCLKSNALKGLKQKMIWCCLIVSKPLVSYLASYFEYDFGTHYDDKNIIFYVMKILTLFTTFVPMQTMKSFHLTLAPYTRIRRSWIKMIFVAILAPVCQIQEMCFEFAFKFIKRPLGFGGIDQKIYRWACAYGIVLCFEMMIMSMFITSYSFRPKDLRLWTYSECMLKPHERTTGYEINENEDDITTNLTGDTMSSFVSEDIRYNHVYGSR